MISLAYISLREKFLPVDQSSRLFHDLQKVLGRMRWRKSSTRSLLRLLMSEPVVLTIGDCLGGSDVIRLSRRITWSAGEDSNEISWQQLKSAVIGVRYLLKASGLPYALWCSCPDFLGGKKGNYRRTPTPVMLGLVDRRKKKGR